MRIREEHRGPRPSSGGQETIWAKRGRHFKERGEEDWQTLPSEAPVFIKLQGSINAMYSETSIDLSFFDTIEQSREVNTVKLTVYIFAS